MSVSDTTTAEENKKLREQVIVLQTEKQSLEVRLNKTEQELRDRGNEWKLDFAQAQSNYESQVSIIENRHRLQIQSITKANELLQTDNDRLHQQIKELKEENSKLRYEITQLQSQLDQLKLQSETQQFEVKQEKQKNIDRDNTIKQLVEAEAARALKDFNNARMKELHDVFGYFRSHIVKKAKMKIPKLKDIKQITDILLSLDPNNFKAAASDDVDDFKRKLQLSELNQDSVQLIKNLHLDTATVIKLQKTNKDHADHTHSFISNEIIDDKNEVKKQLLQFETNVRDLRADSAFFAMQAQLLAFIQQVIKLNDNL